MTRKRDDIPKALDTTLSGIVRDPALFDRVVKAAGNGVTPVKHKMTLSMAFVLVLVLLTSTVAVALTFRGVSYFLTEKAEDPMKLDPDYLFSELDYHHNSKFLNIAVVDAYWDGLELFVAYRIAPVNPESVLRMECTHEEHEHDLPAGDADILIQEPDFVTLTDENGKLTEPSTYSIDWVYEEDGAITIMVRFPRYDMSEYVSITLPVQNTWVSTGEVMRSYLHCVPIRLSDPLADHQHEWTTATCQTAKTCAICQRTEGSLGQHDYHLSEDGNDVICSTCGKQLKKPTFIPNSRNLLPGDCDVFVLALQLRLSELGYYNGSFSELYDDKTIEAVKAYQESHGLDPTGICRTDTVMSLFHSN